MKRFVAVVAAAALALVLSGCCKGSECVVPPSVSSIQPS